MSQATLRTERLLLVPLSHEHLGHEAELDADPQVMRYLTGRARTRDEVDAIHRQRLASAERVRGLGFWAGFTAATADAVADGEFVGWWVLEPPQRADQVPDDPDGDRAATAELGYRLRRRFWRQGLASEGARELVRHGFEDLRLRRIYAETMAVNTASRATMVSVGLRHVRTFHLRWDDPLPGSEHGEVEYALTHDEWTARTPG